MKSIALEKSNYNNPILTSAVLIILSISFTFILSTIQLAFKLPLHIVTIPIAYLLSNIIIHLNIGRKNLFTSNVICITTLLVLYYLISKSYDISWDGQWYHQDAILKLAENWNPFYASYDAQKSISESDIWIHHYPHASWIVQAVILKAGTSIQATKLLTILLSAACFGIAYFVISYKHSFSKIITLIFATCISLNPITFSQFFSFYVDGQSAMCISIYVLLLYYLLDKPSAYISIILAAVFVYSVNIKFTNLVYLSVFNFAFFSWYFIKHPTLRSKTFISYSVLYILAVFIIGYSSYTRNTLEKGHPFYPLMGENNVGEIVGNIHKSANFFDQNRFENFIDASLAKPIYSRNPDSSKFRMPFTEVSYENYYRTDSEMSGFGARWSELLIITLVLLLFILSSKSYRNKTNFIFLISILLFSVFINEQCFEARYVSQLWLFPIMVCIYLYSQNGFFAKFFSLALALLLIYNTAKIIEVQKNHQKEVRKNINLEIEYLKGIKKPIEIKCKYLSVINRLKENNIPFVFIEQENNKQRYQFNYTAEENYYTLP